MEFLHVNAAYPPFIGGAEIYTEAISHRFAAEGHDVTVVTTDAAEVEYFWNPRKRHLASLADQREGVRIVRCPVSHLPLSPWSFYLLRRLATVVGRWAGLSAPVLRRLAPLMPGVPDIADQLEALADGIDLVHGINVALEWPLIAAWRFARRHRLPFVTTPFVHVGESGRRDVLINYTMPHQLEVLQDADAVVVQTNIERHALEQRGVAGERIHRLGMGVDMDKLRGGDASRFRTNHQMTGPIVTFLGVVTYDKGSFHLVQAMDRLWSRGSMAHLVIAGPPVDEFQRFYRGLPAATQERITLLGTVLGREKHDLLAATDIFALPSRIDSFGIVYLEAWACEKPVIGARAGGVPDVIDEGLDGMLVEFGNPDDLAGAIQSLLADPDRARSMGRNGRAKVENRYTWDHVHDRLKAIYRRCLG